MSKLQLEVGKHYISAGGDVFEIVKQREDKTYPFEDAGGGTYTADGKYMISRISAHDLIAECVSSSERTVSIIPAEDVKDTAILDSKTFLSFLNIDLSAYPNVDRMKIVVPDGHMPIKLNIESKNLDRQIDIY